MLFRKTVDSRAGRAERVARFITSGVLVVWLNSVMPHRLVFFVIAAFFLADVVPALVALFVGWRTGWVEEERAVHEANERRRRAHEADELRAQIRRRKEAAERARAEGM